MPRDRNASRARRVAVATYTYRNCVICGDRTRKWRTSTKTGETIRLTISSFYVPRITCDTTAMSFVAKPSLHSVITWSAPEARTPSGRT